MSYEKLRPDWRVTFVPPRPQPNSVLQAGARQLELRDRLANRLRGEELGGGKGHGDSPVIEMESWSVTQTEGRSAE